jgi:hypothetical protein
LPGTAIFALRQERLRIEKFSAIHLIEETKKAAVVRLASRISTSEQKKPIFFVTAKVARKACRP